MVLVGMADQQGVDVEPVLGVAVEAVTELAGDIGRVVVGIVGGGPNVEVDQQRSAGFERYESHVAVVDREERDHCGHVKISFLQNPEKCYHRRSHVSRMKEGA